MYSATRAETRSILRNSEAPSASQSASTGAASSRRKRRKKHAGLWDWHRESKEQRRDHAARARLAANLATLLGKWKEQMVFGVHDPEI